MSASPLNTDRVLDETTNDKLTKIIDAMLDLCSEAGSLPTPSAEDYQSAILISKARLRYCTREFKTFCANGTVGTIGAGLKYEPEPHDHEDLTYSDIAAYGITGAGVAIAIERSKLAWFEDLAKTKKASSGKGESLKRMFEGGLKSISRLSRSP